MFVSTKKTFFIDNWRWGEVPIYIRAGKALEKKATEVYVYFKEVPHNLGLNQNKLIDPNILLFRIQPDEGIHLLFQSKVPGADFLLKRVDMDFCYYDGFNDKILADAYERLLLDVMINDPTLFIRYDEVEASWKFIDKIVKKWSEDGSFPLYTYKKASNGPFEMNSFIAKDGKNWTKENLVTTTCCKKP